MKKLFSLLVMVAMLLPSCQKIEDRIDGLEDRIDQIERTQIATINQQIDAINTTLPQLRDADAELKEYIESLQNTAANLQEQITNTNKDIDELEADLDKTIADSENADNVHKAELLAQLQSVKTELEAELAQINSTIATLQSKTVELEGKIATLEEYVNTELQNIKDWTNATFATLEQYNTIVEDVTTIKAQIEAINTSISKLEERLNTKIATDIATAVEDLEGELAAKVIEITTAYTTAISTAKEELTAAYTEAIATAIAKLESSMKEWVNEQLTGYYTIAEIDAALELLKKSVTDGDAAVLEEVTRLSDRIEAIKTDITQAYQSAIAEAINNNNGVIEGKIADEVSAVNSRIDSEITTINAKISAIESRLDKVESDIADLLSRVQSINYVPTYSDGKASLKYDGDIGYIELDFEVSPKEVLPTLADVWESAVTVKAVVTETRAAEFIILPVESFEVDAANGIVSLRVVGDKLLSPDLDDNQGISVAMSITDGNSSVVSEYIHVVFEESKFSFHVDISFKDLGYYDCAAVAQYPGLEFFGGNSYAGKVVFAYGVEFSSDEHGDFVYLMYDWTGRHEDEYHTEERYMEDLIYDYNKFGCAPEQTYTTLEIGGVYELVGVVFDTNGKPSMLYRQMIIPTWDGCRDPKDFVEWYNLWQSQINPS